MKKDFGDKTHNATSADKARQFRAQATGIGQTRAASEMAGSMRSREVVEHMPPAQRRALVPNSGYPATDMMGTPYEGMAEGAEPASEGY